MAKLYHAEQFELSNKIPVVLMNHDSPVAAIYWWITTGSVDESPAEAGFAHFLEHMLFKDASSKETGVASTGKMARIIESLGGDINAYTSFDQTVYHVTCAAQHWTKILDGFGAMAKPQRFLKTDFEREREVILEELRKNEDSPGRQLFQSLFSSTFVKHPYGRPVIGYAKTLKAAKISQLEAFYKRHYVAGRMGLVLVGPLESQHGKKRRGAILNQLEKYFGSKVLRSATSPARLRPVEPELRQKADWQVKRFDVKTPTLAFSFRVPELEHEDTPALDLLAGVLSMGELSRLYQRLFYQTSLATDVSGGLYVPKDPGMIYFQAEVDSAQKLNQVAEEMFKELQRIAHEGPTQEELERVLVNAESERLYATQTADGMAGRLGFLKFVMGDLNFDQQYLDELRSVDVGKMKEVAKKYFDYRRMSGVVLLPKDEVNFDITEMEALGNRLLDGGSASTDWVGVSPGAFLTPPRQAKRAENLPESIQLPSGIQVCFYPRPSSHVFSIHASVLGGVRLEIAHPIERAALDWGASYLMALCWTKGTAARGARAISALTEGSASSLDGFSGRNSVGLQMTGLARDWYSLSELFLDVLLHPSFPKEEVEHGKRIAEDAIRGIEDHSSQLCSKLFLETLFENHPYGKLTYGTLESIRAIQPEKLKAFHKIWLRPERLVVSVSGAIKWSALEPWLKVLDQQAQAIIKGFEPFSIPRQLNDEPSLKAPRWVERSLGREQCHILVGGLGTQIDSEDRHKIRILQTLLGGQSGRLFMELREKRSLAYTVSPVSFEGIERGYVGTYIACSPKKREEAVTGIRQVLEKLAEKGPTQQEMKRAKAFFLGRRVMDFQSDSALAAHYGLEVLYRVPHLSESNLEKKIKAVSSKDVQSICKRYLIDPHQVTSTVG